MTPTNAIILLSSVAVVGVAILLAWSLVQYYLGDICDPRR
jgi:hypothetical protein